MTTEITLRGDHAVAQAGPLPDLRPQLRTERLLAELGPINWRKVLIDKPYVNDLIRSPRALERLRQDLAEAPKPEQLMHLGQAAAAAIEAKPSRKITATAVAILFDSRARQPANPVTYLGALCSDLYELGFQPAVVTAACQRLRRTTTFIPEIAEVIEVCRKVQGEYVATASLCRRVADYRNAALAAIAEAESALPPPQKPLPRDDVQPGDPDWG